MAKTITFFTMRPPKPWAMKNDGPVNGLSGPKIIKQSAEAFHLRLLGVSDSILRLDRILDQSCDNLKACWSLDAGTRFWHQIPKKISV